MLLELIGFLALSAVLAKLLYLKYNHWRYSHLPGPPKESFIFGHARQLQKSIKSEGCFGVFFLDMVREHGNFFHFWMMMRPVLFVADPLVIKEIVTDFKMFPRQQDRRGFVDRNFSFNLMRMGTVSFCGFNSLLTSPGGPVWRHKKRIMDPAFNMQRLTKHLLKFYEIADSIAEAVVAAQKDDPGGYIDINLITLLYTADAISKAGFSASEEIMKLLRTLKSGSVPKALEASITKGNTVALMLDSKTRKIVFDCANDITKTREIGKKLVVQRTSDGTFGKVEDILDHVISANMDVISGTLDLEETIDDFMAMNAAGSATTNVTVLWSLAELTRNPVVMEKLVAEIDEFWVGAEITRNTSADSIGETIKEMKYLDAFVKEILRYHPPVQIFRRKCSSNVKICGYSIPSDTGILGSQYVMHRWEQYWSDPHKFDPDRFLTITPKPYTYIPFFLGPRQCIGKNFAILEIKTILCVLLERFTVERDPDLPWKIKSVQAVLCFSVENRYSFIPRNIAH